MEMHDLSAIAATCSKRCVLATAIKVEGHAYRKQGVSMLLTEDGSMYGSISPGCLESDLQARVERILDTGQIEIVEYDMRPEDDLSWGETVGCGGLVIVLLEPVQGTLQSMLVKMNECLQTGTVVQFTRIFQQGFSKMDYRLSLTGIADEKAYIFELEQSALTEHIRANESSDHAKPQPISRLKETESVYNGTKLESASVKANPWDLPSLLTSTYYAKPRLVIIGAGNDVLPVVKLAQLAGFRIVVADWRESLCTAERFPGVGLCLGFPREILSALQLNREDYILLMSHQFPREREILELLSEVEYAYLGIMGSKTRTERLLNGLPPLSHVHSPVGLSIGAEGPDEIAISIAAELIASKRSVAAARRKAQKEVEHGTDGYSACSR
ncbi:XdhC/CoxI family protein [Paenibacillus sp. MER 99-2]|uniref:XdhC family protein n=1 Tax=Paenibacillus sp. MER 99-2 TaxID=2939572 RepID=UPI002041CACF|nr:XdhC/CoxI family protein [Paenibacillus sp. MER 99-2]MCM3172174.1 XdhC family protein [Paenibacillus sp. MER 99-2]